MKVTMGFKHLESTDSIKNFVIEKSAKLEKYFHGKIQVSWNFTVEKLNHVAHCHLVGNHMDYFSEGVTTDLYASIDLALTKLETQLRKHKEIVTGHHKYDKIPVSP